MPSFLSSKRYVFFFILLFTFVAFGQDVVLENTNIENLKEMAKRFQEKYERQKAEALAKAQQEGWIVRKELGKGKVMELMSLDAYGNPVYYITDNLNAAKTISTNNVWPGGSAGLSLDGSGMIAGEWDEGQVLASHQELTGRITQKDSPSDTSDHSTHVAGTILASGVQANAHGMATAAHLDAYDWDNDDSEMSTAASAGLLISNHSYGIGVGWYFFGLLWAGDENISSEEDYKFGFYDTDHSQAWDQIAFDAPYFLIMKSAGNDRGEGSNSNGHEVDGGANGYDCIGPQGVAKNILTIGAVDDITTGWTQSSDVVMSSFSSWGPTDDGRIKPDLVANGVGVYSCISTGNTDYDTFDGTSMATPNATGSLLLLQQHYKALSGGTPMRAATLKALAIHTADEAGDGPGPDYRFGWGLINTEKAALLIDSVWTDQKESTIKEESLSEGGTYSIQVTSDGSKPLRATICWTDPPGTPVAAQLDPPDIMLVNDLDLRITGNSTTYYPWKFDSPDPNTPSNTATTGDNIRDNVEQVLIASPSSGTYTITVSHKGTLTDGPQAFSLIMSGAYYSDASLPVEMASFTATGGNKLAVLNWKTESEIDNLGFNIYRSRNKTEGYEQIANFKSDKDLKGLGSSSVGKTYQYYDFDLENNTAYWYKIEDVSINGQSGLHGPVTAFTDASSSLTKESLLPPDDFQLAQNYPNPFNPSTNIKYQLPKQANVRIVVFNALGQKVRTLVNERQEAGQYSVTFNASGLSSGIYFYRLTVGSQISQIHKMVLLR